MTAAGGVEKSLDLAAGAYFILINPESAVEPKMPEARSNPGAAKASDCEVSSDFALSHDVAVRLKRSLEAPMSDLCSEAQTHRLRCGTIVPRTSCPITTAESGIKAIKTGLISIIILGAVGPGIRET